MPVTKMPMTTTQWSASRSIAVAAIGSLALFWAHALAQGQSQPSPSLAGTYLCKPNPDPCAWPGRTPSISQSGNKLQIKGDKGETADAILTSNTTISAAATFNSTGIIRPDHSIDWSDGTKWNKQ
jgi:hypothetical protein